MLSLFPSEPVGPPGFEFYPNFLSTEEERELIGHCEATELHTFNFQGYEAKRKVASFGYDWDFTHRTLSKGKDIPPAFNSLINKVTDKLAISRDSIAELLVTEYPQDSVINWHRDAPPFDLIAGISLLSDCVFRFRPHEVARRGRTTTLSIDVPSRSLYVMKGLSRSDWQHSIKPVKSRRFSITLRTLKA
jgi:alkylated DNA repair dioxygenase AlkB